MIVQIILLNIVKFSDLKMTVIFKVIINYIVLTISLVSIDIFSCIYTFIKNKSKVINIYIYF